MVDHVALSAQRRCDAPIAISAFVQIVDRLDLVSGDRVICPRPVGRLAGSKKCFVPDLQRAGATREDIDALNLAPRKTVSRLIQGRQLTIGNSVDSQN